MSNIVDWRLDILNPLAIILGFDYKDRLPNYAYKYPPKDGIPMELIPIDEIDVEMPDKLCGKRKYRDNISETEELLAREQYNKDIRNKGGRISRYIGDIKSSYIRYVSNHGIYPINSTCNIKTYCLVCYKHFQSRNKLFKHLYQTNHYYELDINTLKI